ncbi:DUF6597 domain-containing transcriptional factor [Cohnella kolymensis]|uniref:DUF6597 domain-containing transcriptional factor n=1 Tax=Cohnella kolymensis TaxID=1590652 RepID=UPI000696EF98|nr:DUF6597 domain-containing transcriptional factor [Cohnella kolymensis]
MGSITFNVVPPVEALKSDVEYFRISEYKGTDGVAVKVCPNGLPGIVFQHSNGQSAIQSIVTSSGYTVQHLPTLYLYGQITELAVMNFKSGPYTTVQAVLKPHALKSLFGIDASTVSNGSMMPHEFAAEDLNTQLITAKSSQDYITLFSTFLLDKLKQTHARDPLIEESLHFIHTNISSITVKNLLAHLHLSERQFEKRFVQSVGVSPQFYLFGDVRIIQHWNPAAFKTQVSIRT